MTSIVGIRADNSKLVLDQPTTLRLDELGQTLLGKPLLEQHLEELVCRYPGVLLDGDDQDSADSLLIIGEQVRNVAGGIADVVAVDGTGALVLIELKRDAAASSQRGEPFEWQAVRYAASYALLKTVDDVVRALFAPYIVRHKAEFASELTHLAAEELARRKLQTFLDQNGSLQRFNRKQRIVLVATSFEPQVLSACAWLVNSQVDIRCVQVTPLKLDGRCFLSVETILSGRAPSDFYVGLTDGTISRGRTERRAGKSVPLPRIEQLVAWGVLKPGDELYVRTEPNKIATAIDDDYVSYEGKQYRYNEWGLEITGWTAINIYDRLILKRAGRSLDELRREEMSRQASTPATLASEADVSAPLSSDSP